jgi:hypothetical protein
MHANGRAGAVFGGFGSPRIPAGMTEPELRRMLELLDRLPGPWDQEQANPLPVIQAVNALQPLGKERVLAVVREFVRLNVWAVSPYEVFNVTPHGVYPLMRLLFTVDPARKDEFLSSHDHLVLGDVPFNLDFPRGGRLGTTLSEEGLRSFGRHGRLRARPLRPPDRPWELLAQLKGHSSWPREPADQAWMRRAFMAQVLWLLRPIYRGPADEKGILVPRGEELDAWWKRTVTELEKLHIRWDTFLNSYTFRDGSRLPDDPLPAGDTTGLRADGSQRRMSDGSVLTLVGAFLGTRDLRQLRRGTARGEALTVWTTRTGIVPEGSVFTSIVALDAYGRAHKLAYEGGIFQGPPPEEWKEEWVLPDPPPLGRPLRLRFAFEGQDAREGLVEFTLPYDEAWRARQFDAHTPDKWMAEAVDRICTDTMATMLDRGARVHVRGRHGWTPLMTAAFAGDTALVRRLLDGGAARDSRNDSGATALFYAVVWKRVDVVELLLSRGADPNLNAAGRLPLEWASEPRIIRALRARGAVTPGSRRRAHASGQGR